MIEILKRTHGRAFVLFTSYATMRAVQAMAEMALDYPILAQGTAPRSQLLNQFRDTPHAVLFATSSFWQGVDVVGEALSCVIVDKIPFASPGDPITAARIEQIRARGGDPFGEYQVPLAILALQQGLGRLIRHRRDRGVLAVLDPRLRTMGYGRRFVASLPPAPIVHDLDEHRDVLRIEGAERTEATGLHRETEQQRNETGVEAAARDGREADHAATRRPETQTVRTDSFAFPTFLSPRAGPATPARRRALLSVPPLLCVIPFPP